jgi:hypothetical protein
LDPHRILRSRFTAGVLQPFAYSPMSRLSERQRIFSGRINPWWYSSTLAPVDRIELPSMQVNSLPQIALIAKLECLLQSSRRNSNPHHRGKSPTRLSNYATRGWFSYRVLPPAPDLKRISHRCNALGECFTTGLVSRARSDGLPVPNRALYLLSYN